MSSWHTSISKSRKEARAFFNRADTKALDFLHFSPSRWSRFSISFYRSQRTLLISLRQEHDMGDSTTKSWYIVTERMSVAIVSKKKKKWDSRIQIGFHSSNHPNYTTSANIHAGRMSSQAKLHGGKRGWGKKKKRRPQNRGNNLNRKKQTGEKKCWQERQNPRTNKKKIYKKLWHFGQAW